MRYWVVILSIVNYYLIHNHSYFDITFARQKYIIWSNKIVHYLITVQIIKHHHHLTQPLLNNLFFEWHSFLLLLLNMKLKISLLTILKYDCYLFIALKMPELFDDIAIINGRYYLNLSKDSITCFRIESICFADISVVL